MQDNYSLLIRKLDKFIRKYYVNELIRGAIFFGAFALVLFLVINVTEYYLYLSSGLRKLLFFGFIASSLLILFRFVLLPLFHYYRLGKIISHEQAAKIVGDHFENVKDKLLNILQLKKASASNVNTELVSAGIDQKIFELKPVTFTSAINLGNNRQYLKYLLPPLSIFIVVLFANPNIIKDGSKRLINSGTRFERAMPFSFNIANKKLEVLQYEDFKLRVEVDGKALPSEVFIQVRNNAYKLQSSQPGTFTYDFVNLQKDETFFLTANGFNSKDYVLDVLPKPQIVNFSVDLDYPGYIGRKDEQLNNIGDLVVPAGTKANWNFSATNTRNILIHFSDSSYPAARRSDQEFQFYKRLFDSDRYMIKVSNEHVFDADSISYTINVTPDQYPTIRVTENRDSTNPQFLYYLGEVSDDYGLRKLQFKYQFEYADSNNQLSEMFVEKIPLRSDKKQDQFSHYWDLSQIGLRPGDKITYYFEVWDNDGVNGSKSSKSNLMVFEMPTLDQFETNTEKNNDEIKDDLKKSMDEAKKLQEELKDIKEKLLDKKTLSWEDKQSVEELLQRQKDLENKMKQLNEKFDNNIEQQAEYKEVNKDIQKKQEMLQELFDQVMTDEMKELFEKMEKMLEEVQKEEMLEDLEDLEMTDENLEKELDRMLELFKQLEFDQKLEETIDKLDELAEKQEELSEESKEKSADAEEIKEKQDELNKEFDKVQEDVESLQEMNSEMENKADFTETDKAAEKAEESMQNSSEQLSKNNKNNASEEQKNASDQMKEMSEQMSAMQMDMQMDQMSEDMDALRQLLENLVLLSFEEEQLMDDLRETSINNPKYVELVQKQFKLKDDSEMVEDSLYALAKRVFQIEAFVTKEITEINKNLRKGLKQLEDRKVREANMHQQYVMTGYNNLALMLSEVMDQMQQAMAQQMEGSQMCQNPKNNPGGKMPSLQQMQKQLSDQISEMKEGMKPGEKPNGKKMSKGLAQMAAKQAAIREKLREISNQENKDGKNSMGDLEELQDLMEQTETDLVNKQLTNELLKRQKEIETRLLEAVNAERQREKEKKRESKTAEELTKTIPPSIEEYLRKREAEIELYRTVPPALKPYYKSLVEKYFRSINFNNN